MKRVLLLAALAGCGDNVTGNPVTLWLSDLPGDETHVELIDHEPPPF